MATEEYYIKLDPSKSLSIEDYIYTSIGMYDVVTEEKSKKFLQQQRHFTLLTPTDTGSTVISIFCPGDPVVLIPVGRAYGIFPDGEIKIVGEDYGEDNFNAWLAIARFDNDKVRLDLQSMLHADLTDPFIADGFQELGEIVYKQFFEGKGFLYKTLWAHTALTPDTSNEAMVKPF